MRTDSLDSPDGEDRSQATTCAAPGARSIGSVIRGRYELQAPLGRGGMGVVYRARDLVLGRDVAIKFVRDSASPTLRARFLREAHLASRVQDPHTVYVLDFGALPEGDCFLVMELLVGRTLADALAESGAMNSLRVCRIGAMIASGMQSLHTHGVVHRDLKPANILLLDKQGTPDFVKIFDFGVAKDVIAGPASDDTLAGSASGSTDSGARSPDSPSAENEPLTRPGALIGTPRYMAPEQLRGEPLDARADQYALGCILYELATGQPPFQGDVTHIKRGHLYGEIITPRKRQPTAGISAQLEAVILRAMARRRAARFGDMGELGKALEAESERLLRRPLLDARAAARFTRIAIAAAIITAATAGSFSKLHRQIPAGSAPALQRNEISLPPAHAAPPPDTPTTAAISSIQRSTEVALLRPVRAQAVAREAHEARAPAPTTSRVHDAVPKLITQAADALAKKDFFHAQRLLESADSGCPRGHGTVDKGAARCAEVALYLGRVQEAAGNFAEAIAEYARVLEDTAALHDQTPILALRTEADVATKRLKSHIGRILLTHLRDGRCETVELLLPEGEHQFEQDGELKRVTLRARETRRIGSCITP